MSQHYIPLAERLRPQSLTEYLGQTHLLGENGTLQLALKVGQLPSMILWGPPGVGKTTLAQLLAKSVDEQFIALSAINAGVKDLREVIAKNENRNLFSAKKPILFIDEIHRFNKSQQDALLGAVEKGVITLIGATTENPSFEVNAALLSRCQVYILKAHTDADLELLLERALSHDPWLNGLGIAFKETEALKQFASGDARRMLNLVELVAQQAYALQLKNITNQTVKEVASSNPLFYDKGGEQHYDTISAFIKSVRGSDADAALYYLARMLKAGEDPKFIARRMIILAAEDIGLANPTALVMANAAFDAVEKIGMPEARIVLSQVVIYLALSPKSNSAYKAIAKAYELAEAYPNEPIPLYLRNAPTALMKELGYGKAYQYPHDFEHNWINQSYLPEKLEGKVVYSSLPNAREYALGDWLRKLKQAK